jgi:serine/threonine protein kinase
MVALLKSSTYEYQEQKLFIEHYVLRLRIKVEDLIAYHHERNRKHPVTLNNLMGAYNWSRKGRKRAMKHHWEITENQLRFDFEDVIGQGSFGTVLRGLYNRTEFDGDDAADPVTLKRFEASNANLKKVFHELSVLNQLHHNNVVQCPTS